MVTVALVGACALTGCASGAKTPVASSATSTAPAMIGSKAAQAADVVGAQLERLDIVEDMRPAFDHGEKGREFQRYIVLHDTESEADAASIVEYWDQAGTGVAAHFIVNRDGSIVQCVPLDRIAHHAGFGDTGSQRALRRYGRVARR